MPAKVPQEIKNTVSFIFVKNKKGELVPNGTGFFVALRSRCNHEVSHVYLVTAKHVLQDSQGKFYPSVFLRLNRIGGDVEVVEVALGVSGSKVHTHDEPGVDIAVLPCLPSQARFDFKCIPEEMLVTKQRFVELTISEGDEVFFTGLFLSHFGQHRNYPIVRFGRVALISEEPVDWKGELLDLYLVETQSFGGNSGSPVFFLFGATRQPGQIRLGGTQVFLAGVMKGSFLKRSKIRVADTKPTPVSVENVGIAGVVPCYKLYEVLFSDELETARADLEQATPST